VPAADDPRVTVRLSKDDHARLLKEAVRRGVKVGTCLRDLALERLGGEQPQKVQAIRSQVGQAAVDIAVPFEGNPGPGWQEGVSPARPVPPKIPGVTTARELAKNDLMMERQARLNWRP
jgi:hypothetical protein